MSGSLSVIQCTTILFASGVGTGVLVLPYTVSAVGWGVFSALLGLGWVTCTATTLVLFLATVNMQGQEQARMGIVDPLTKPLLRAPEKGVEEYISNDDEPADACVVSASCVPSLSDLKSYKVSYGDLVMASVGQPWIVRVLDVIVLLECLGTAVAYFVFLASFLRQLPFWDLGEVASLLVIAVAVCPFMIGNSIGALCHLSSISVFAFLFVVAIVICEAPAYAEERAASLQPVGDVAKIPEALCVCVFAYMWHSNVPIVARELHNPTPMRCLIVSALAPLVVTLVYVAVGFGGYYSFGDATRSNIVDMYPRQEWLFVGLRLALSASIFTATVMVLLPTRASTLALLQARFGGTPVVGPIGNQCLGLALVGLSFGAAALAPGIISIVRLIGGTLATLLMIVFPSIVARIVLSSRMANLSMMISVPASLVLMAAGLGFFG